MKFHRIQTQTNYYKYSFFPTFVPLWNSLPPDAVTAEKLESFKESISNHFIKPIYPQNHHSRVFNLTNHTTVISQPPISHQSTSYFNHTNTQQLTSCASHKCLIDSDCIYDDDDDVRMTILYRTCYLHYRCMRLGHVTNARAPGTFTYMHAPRAREKSQL